MRDWMYCLHCDNKTTKIGFNHDYNMKLYDFNLNDENCHLTMSVIKRCRTYYPLPEITIFWVFNILRPRQNCRHFTDNIFKCIVLNENVWISLKIWLKFVLKFPINNIPAMVQIMAWCCSGNKPLSEPMMISLLTHICVTQPQWVKCGKSKSATMKHAYNESVINFNP